MSAQTAKRSVICIGIHVRGGCDLVGGVERLTYDASVRKRDRGPGGADVAAGRECARTDIAADRECARGDTPTDNDIAADRECARADTPADNDIAAGRADDRTSSVTSIHKCAPSAPAHWILKRVV